MARRASGRGWAGSQRCSRASSGWSPPRGSQSTAAAHRRRGGEADMSYAMLGYGQDDSHEYPPTPTPEGGGVPALIKGICEAGGGTWVNDHCVDKPASGSNPPAKKASDSAMPFIVGAVAIGAIIYLMKKR